MSNESRAKFEDWYENDHSGGIDSLSSDWDEERNCYKNHANHLAWKAYDSRQSEIDSLRAENERLSDELLNLSKWKEINGFRGDSWQGQLSEALNDVARELRNVAKGQSNG